MTETYEIVVIDDLRNPLLGTGNIIVTLHRTAEDGLRDLQERHARGSKVDELWLDHDLGIDYSTGDDLTIKPVVEWLERMAFEETPLSVDYIFVHTSNPYAGDSMVAGLSRYYNVRRDELPLAP